MRRRDRTCAESGCRRRVWTIRTGTSYDFCRAHYIERWRIKYWTTRGGWPPGRRVDTGGYAWVLVNDKWRHEHKVVMERELGRPLRKGETVHHRNGKRADNRPENLELWLQQHQSGQRAVELMCPHCGKPYLDKGV